MTRTFFFLGIGFLALSFVAYLIGKGFGKGVISVLGHLPGDIVVDRPGFKLYFPLMTSLLLSVLLTLILYFFSRFSGRS